MRIALPMELQELIFDHLAAGRIQRCFRHHQMRHVNKREWSNLRRLLVRNGTRAELDVLTRNTLVRREWRSEPSSWIREVERMPRLVTVVSAEVVNGVWENHAT